MGKTIIQGFARKVPINYSITCLVDVSRTTYGHTLTFRAKPVTLPDGSRHELRKDDDSHTWNENITGKFYAVDGSGLMYDKDTGTLYLPDGSRFVTETSGQKYIDRFGNTLTYNYSTKLWKDTLGRTFGLPLPASHTVGDNPSTPTTDYTYSLPGINSSVNYQMHWKKLSDSGVINESETDQTFRYKGSPGTPCNFTFGNPGLFGSSGNEHVMLRGTTVFDPVVLHQIELPNGQTYTFKYNIYGEITKIIYPTGAYERFVYNSAPTLSGQFDTASSMYSQGNRGVTDRYVSPDGTSSSELHWNYTDFTVTAPDGTRTEVDVFRTYSERIANGFDNPLSGKTYETRTYNANNQLLRRSLTKWTVNRTIQDYGGAIGKAYKQRNPRVTKQIVILFETGSSSALAKTTTFEHDQYLNVTRTIEYDFVVLNDANAAKIIDIVSISAGTALRTTETTYSTDSGYINRNMISLPTSTIVRDGGTSGEIKSKTLNRTKACKV